MPTFSLHRLGLRLTTFGIWGLAAGRLTFWTLRLTTTLDTARPTAPLIATANVDSGAVARALGGASAVSSPGIAQRFTLQGVVAGRPEGSAALIAVDGKPAAAFRVGSIVAEGLFLHSVTGRRATVAASREGPPILILEMSLLEQ